MYRVTFDKKLDTELIYSDDIVKEIFIKDKGKLNFSRCAEPFLKDRPNLYYYIKNRFPVDEFLDIGTNIKRICNNVMILKMCKNPLCNNKVKNLNYDYCCCSCAASDPDTIKKKYDSAHLHNPNDPYNQESAYKTAHKNNPDDPYNSKQATITLAEKHPDDPTYGRFGSKKFLENMIDKHGDPYYNNRPKAKETIDRYKKENPNYITDITVKRMNTINERIKENPNYWKDIWRKIKKTKAFNHPEEPNKGEFGSETNKQIMFNLYGEEYFINTQLFKEKTLNKLLEKYGVDNIAKYKPVAMKRGEHSRLTKIERGIILDYTKIDVAEYQNYCALVRWLSNHVYTEFIHIINANNLQRGAQDDAYHLDHIYSVSKGWENKIPIWVMCCPVNLRMLNSRDNIRKSKRCDIIETDLYNKAFEFIYSCPEYLKFLEEKYNHYTSSGSSKNQKAQQLGIQIITEQQFLDVIK